MAKESEDTPQGDELQRPRRKSLLLVSILGGVMLAEGVGLFFVMRMFGSGPQETLAELTQEGLAEPQEPAAAEVKIAQFKALNEKSGHTFVVDIELSARVPAGRQAEVESLVNLRKDTVLDRFNQLVRSADPKHLKEEDLATLRRLMTAELSGILGDEDLVDEVLITRFNKFRADM